MNEKEIIERLIGIIERLLDENELLRKSHFITSPDTPLTYPSTTYPGTVPTTWPAPTITYETKGNA